MRLYISCDMEGTAGICSWMQCDPSNRYEYPVYRRYMSREIRAAIDGARGEGATGATINDAHWDMKNVLWDELPSDVRMISGGRKPLSMMQGIGDGFDGAFFTGYHAAAGTAGGVLAHTYSPDCIYAVRVNGIPCSEALLNAAMAGHGGVPLLLITGDRTVVEHVREHMPWTTGVIVKEGIGHYATDSMTPAAARELIRDGAARAVRERAKARPFTFEPPLTLEIDTARVEQADFIELLPGFERTGGRTMRFRHKDYPEIFRAFLVAMRLGAAATVTA
jgi:D-amino peptidase